MLWEGTNSIGDVEAESGIASSLAPTATPSETTFEPPTRRDEGKKQTVLNDECPPLDPNSIITIDGKEYVLLETHSDAVCLLEQQQLDMEQEKATCERSLELSRKSEFFSAIQKFLSDLQVLLFRLFLVAGVYVLYIRVTGGRLRRYTATAR
jgi:hypothetical protein